MKDPTRARAAAKSMAPNTIIRGRGANEETNTRAPSPRRSPSGPYPRVSVRPPASRPRASSATAASKRSEPNVPRTGVCDSSGRTTSRRPSRPASGCSTTVHTATARPASMSAASSSNPGKDARSTRSTNTSRMPPHVRPTANASSSLTPYRCSTGDPDAITSLPSSYTAPSTQPPDTLPTASPSGPTSIAAPAGRGADRQVATTVPIATVRPSRHQPSRSSITSRTAHQLQQLGERRQRVTGHEVVNVRDDGGDSGLHRPVPVLAAVRVQPDQAVGQPGQALRLLAEQRGVAPLPAVRADDEDGAARHPPLPPPVGERAQHLAEAGPSGPVRHLLPRQAKGRVRVTGPAQGRCQPGQAGADAEHLDPVAVRDRGAHQQVAQPEQGIGVRRHRAGDVDEQHDAARSRRPPPPAQRADLPSPAQLLTHGRAGVEVTPPGTATPSGPALRQMHLESREEARQLGALGRGQVRDVTVPQHLRPTGVGPDSFRVPLGAGSGRRLAQRRGHVRPPDRRRPAGSCQPPREPCLEDPVVDGPAVGVVAQGRAARPVDAGAVARADLRHLSLIHISE